MNTGDEWMFAYTNTSVSLNSQDQLIASVLEKIATRMRQVPRGTSVRIRIDVERTMGDFARKDTRCTTRAQ